GGTSNHIHAGHKIYITMMALLLMKSIVLWPVRIKIHREFVASTEIRIENAKQFLHVFRRAIECVVVPNSDSYGPTINVPTLQALVISKE
ncbi:hypothetical protein BDB00DRAFT_735032, partial [Zychaea mexicana]|uniref:uncharacterized protein n=1 Tax=Zychaea mexicana TaxID=64656 RepID=UPI0022FF2DA2